MSFRLLPFDFNLHSVYDKIEFYHDIQDYYDLIGYITHSTRMKIKRGDILENDRVRYKVISNPKDTKWVVQCRFMELKNGT